MSDNPKHIVVQDWPNMARSINEAAAQLHLQYGEEGIPAEVLQREAERIGGYRTGSVLPSDYCYNIINRASYSFQHLVLVLVGRGRYKYVGPGYDYSGPIMWRPKHGEEQQVGSWDAGDCTLEHDPRQTQRKTRTMA